MSTSPATARLHKRSVSVWRVWAKALGEKSSKCDRESDKVALVRTIIFASYLLTNCFIVSGVIRHWQKESPAEAGLVSTVSAGGSCREHLDRPED